MLDDNMTMIASALAYSTFFAIPSVLLAVVGLFTLLAGPGRSTRLSDISDSDARSGDAAPSREPGPARPAAVGGADDDDRRLRARLLVDDRCDDELHDRSQPRLRAKRQPSVRKKRVTALAMVVCIGVAFLLVAGLLIFGPPIEKYLGDALGTRSVLTYVWWSAQWPILIAGLLAAFATLLWLGPDVEHPRWRFLTVGSAIAVAIWLLASGAFALYTASFGSYNKTWGSLAAVIIMLTWLWLTSLALLFGAEFNAEAERSRELRQAEPAEPDFQLAARSASS